MSRRRLVTLVSLAAVLVVAGFVGVVVATSGSSSDRLVVYTARSHYGEEQPFKDFAADTDTKLTLFGGEASELYERIKSEGDDTRADVLITVDAANLWRATEAGLLEKVDDPELERNVPAGLRDPGDHWFGLTVRARTIMRSTERVGPEEVTTYAGLGDPRWKGRLCLRSGTSDYNVSFVADRIAKDGREETKAMLERWMANDPEILGSDVDVLDAIADGSCDVGLTNSYYLGRELEEDPDFPVAPVWADQNGRGTHVNLSGLGVVKGTDQRAKAIELMQYLTEPKQQELFAHNNFEFAADPDVRPAEEIAQFGTFKRDPIDVQGAGEHLEDALQLMEEVGWD
ncbi:MAG: extracellular solute-binding protein [Thermoleophilaceae bacterium]|nr:extracellular solute-binding protein [Thermoleophilaceae bacterium]